MNRKALRKHRLANRRSGLQRKWLPPAPPPMGLAHASPQPAIPPVVPEPVVSHCPVAVLQTSFGPQSASDVQLVAGSHARLLVTDLTGLANNTAVHTGRLLVHIHAVITNLALGTICFLGFWGAFTKGMHWP